MDVDAADSYSPRLKVASAQLEGDTRPVIEYEHWLRASKM